MDKVFKDKVFWLKRYEMRNGKRECVWAGFFEYHETAKKIIDRNVRKYGPADYEITEGERPQTISVY